jgi:hypothetical protein
MIRLLCEDTGYEVREVDCAGAALAFLAAEGLHVGVCFADLGGAAEMNPADFASELYREYPWIKVAISSSLAVDSSLPASTRVTASPWLPLEIIMQAESANDVRRRAKLASH